MANDKTEQNNKSNKANTEEKLLQIRVAAWAKEQSDELFAEQGTTTQAFIKMLVHLIALKGVTPLDSLLQDLLHEQIGLKDLNNRIDELEGEVEKLKAENKALKKVHDS